MYNERRSNADNAINSKAALAKMTYDEKCKVLAKMTYDEKCKVADFFLSEIIKLMNASGSFRVKLFAVAPLAKNAKGEYETLPQFEVATENDSVRTMAEDFFSKQIWDSAVINILLRKAVTNSPKCDLTLEHHYSTETDVMVDREEYCIISRK